MQSPFAGAFFMQYAAYFDSCMPLLNKHFNAFYS